MIMKAVFPKPAFFTPIILFVSLSFSPFFWGGGQGGVASTFSKALIKYYLSHKFVNSLKVKMIPG